MANVRLSYLYRDDGNYKQYGYVIFERDKNIGLHELTTLLTNKLIDGLWFYASKWQVADLHFEKWDDELDHTFHEFECIEYTDEAPNTLLTLAKFKALIEQTTL